MERYFEKTYSGVLGKIIGVYLGRPVEGWAYQKIIDTFGDVPYYKHKECNVPLIVADDDISGTFAFFRALEDCGYRKEMSAKDVGNAWLNYIIENKTILWWGGLGRSTEHTAFLNLKNGISAPQSGSIAQNGSTLAEQIGAQIFVDAFAMACPGNPDLAVQLTRNAASVSHDGIAVEAACYLAAMEAMAFEEKDINKLMDAGLRYVKDERLLALIKDVRAFCDAEKDWRRVRELIDAKYGYHLYPGCCHMVPNHAMVLASLILGGDDFQKSILIAASAGYDTDCNAGNVGCLNGIRLGLSGIDAGADLRAPVADQMYVVSSDGGNVISDAVRETYRILKAAAALHGSKVHIPKERFNFSFPGSVQGFEACPYSTAPHTNVYVANEKMSDGKYGLAICCRGVGAGYNACVSTQTFLEKGKTAVNFSTIASPTLYGTQTITAELNYEGKNQVTVSPYILYYDKEEQIQRVTGPTKQIEHGRQEIIWELPDTKGMPIFRVGFEVGSEKRFDGKVYLCSLNWNNSPKAYELKGMLMTSIWATTPSWLQTWTSSAKQFQADFKYTMCLSHPEENGVATIGTEDWSDYKICSRLMFSLHKTGGMVLRSKGHRRYYAAVLKDYNKAAIIMRRDERTVVLAETDFLYVEDRLYALEFSAKGDKLIFSVDGKELLSASDTTYNCGGAGMMVEYGTLCADGFGVYSLEE